MAGRAHYLSLCALEMEPLLESVNKPEHYPRPWGSLEAGSPNTSNILFPFLQPFGDNPQPRVPAQSHLTGCEEGNPFCRSQTRMWGQHWGLSLLVGTSMTFPSSRPCAQMGWRVPGLLTLVLGGSGGKLLPSPRGCVLTS